MAQRYSRTAEILEIYERHGGLMGIARLARLCLEEGVWSDHERDQMAFSDAKRQCHGALKSKDATGLPVAGLAARSAGRTNVWKQLPLWDFEDAVFNLGIRIKQQASDYGSIRTLWSYIDKRWGQAPVIPTLEYPEDQPIWWLDIPTIDDEDA
jgi:hypothetical protein